MGNHTEQFEGNQPQEAKAFNPSLSNYGMERQDPGISARDTQMKTDDLVAKNVLPDLSFLDNIQPGEPASRQAIKEAGIKCAHEGDAKNSISTTEFPNGVKITQIESPPHKVEGKPNVTVDGGMTVIEGAKEVPPMGSGKYVDATGRQVAQVNEDGTITVEGGNGKFFTVQKGGRIIEQSAYRSRDGKSFTVVDTNNVINERPGDVVAPEKKH